MGGQVDDVAFRYGPCSRVLNGGQCSADYILDLGEVVVAITHLVA